MYPTVLFSVYCILTMFICMQHSAPASELFHPFFPTFMGPTKLRSFHRQPLKKYSHGTMAETTPQPVRSLRKIIARKAKVLFEFLPLCSNCVLKESICDYTFFFYKKRGTVDELSFKEKRLQMRFMCLLYHFHHYYHHYCYTKMYRHLCLTNCKNFIMNGEKYGSITKLATHLMQIFFLNDPARIMVKSN